MDPKNINPFQVFVSGTNLVSQSEYPSQSAKAPEGMRMAMTLPKGMVLDVPTKSCSVGHRFELKITTDRRDDDPMEFTAQVVKKDDGNTGRSEIEVKFLQFDPDSWNFLRAELEANQKNVQEMLKAVRGY